MARAAWPLTPGLPALDAFPYALWGRLEGRFWRRRPIPDLSYGDPQGFLPLREALAEYLGAARGVDAVEKPFSSPISGKKMTQV